MVLLIKNQALSPYKKDALPSSFFFLGEHRCKYISTPFLPFVVHVSFNSARLFDWQQLACQSRRKSGRRGLGSKREGETHREGGSRVEEDISNSKRHVVFPWQLGFHRNNLAKDAISVKKYLLTLYCTACTQIQEHILSYTSRLHLQDTWAHSCTWFYLLTHLRSIIRAQSQATHFESSVMGLAFLTLCHSFSKLMLLAVLVALVLSFVVNSLLKLLPLD